MHTCVSFLLPSVCTCAHVCGFVTFWIGLPACSSMLLDGLNRIREVHPFLLTYAPANMKRSYLSLSCRWGYPGLGALETKLGRRGLHGPIPINKHSGQHVEEPREIPKAARLHKEPLRFYIGSKPLQLIEFAPI